MDIASGNEGFLEDGWLDGTLEVGEHLQLAQMRPTLRCVMTADRQADLM